MFIKNTLRLFSLKNLIINSSRTLATNLQLNLCCANSLEVINILGKSNCCNNYQYQKINYLKEVKMMILNEIDKNKFILFGAYTDKRTKAFTWESIFHKAWSQGAYQNKTWRYLRDAAWPNMRKCTLVKIEKSQNADKKYGYFHQFTDVDIKIMQILQINVTPDVKTEPQYNGDTGQIETKVEPQYNSHPNEIQQAKVQPQYNNSHHTQILQNQEPSINTETETVKEEPTTNYIEESSSSATSSTIDEVEQETQSREDYITTNINEYETSSPESKRKKRSNQMAELNCEKLKLEIEILKRNKSTSELDMENKLIENKILALQLMKLENELGVRSSQD